MVTMAFAACAVERGNQPPEQAARRGAGASPHGAAGDSLPGAMHAVFDSLRETVAPGVERLTLRMMVLPEAGRAAQQAAMEAVADAVRKRDSSLAALRVLALLPPEPGHEQAPHAMALVPLAYLEWVPPGGWDSLTARTARLAHTTQVMFVQDLPSHPRLPGGPGGRPER